MLAGELSLTFRLLYCSTLSRQQSFLTGIVVVQSDACFEAMQIDWPVVRQQAIHRGVIMTRVAVRDFDHNDQVMSRLLCVNSKSMQCCTGAR